MDVAQSPRGSFIKKGVKPLLKLDVQNKANKADIDNGHFVQHNAILI